MKDILVGHRGEPETWPENSLIGYRAVLQAGARYLETDVQVTADGIPVLCHDPSLHKVTGHDLVVTETLSETVLSLPAGQPERFGEQFADLRISTLVQFAELLGRWPDARAFIEIKHASVVALGVDRVIGLVLDALADVLPQSILISFEDDVLEYARSRCALPIGWVLPRWDDEARRRAESLTPDYLFVNRTRVPPAPEPLWPGPWRWVVYTVNEPEAIEPLCERGFDMVETNVISRLLARGDLLDRAV